jgi:hypothetical protein
MILFLALLVALHAPAVMGQATTTLQDVLGPQVYVAPEDECRRIYNNTGVSLVEGDIVYISSWNETNFAWYVAKADCDDPAKLGQYIVSSTIGDAQYGVVKKGFLSSKAMNTNGSSVGDPVYLSATAGGWTLAIPTGADQDVQIVGRVTIVSATVGQIRFWFEAVPQKRGTSSLQAGAITSASIAANTIDAGDIATGGVATAEILDGTILNEDVGAAAAIARSKLAEDALAVYGISMENVRSDAGASLTAAETAGTFDVTVGTNTIVINGEVTDNETETSVGYIKFILPAEYVSAGDVTVRLRCAVVKTGGATDNGSSIDVEAYEQTDGAVGSDICATAAQTFAALDTWYNKDFTITAAGLVAGDVLIIKITSSIIDSEAGAGTLVFNMEPKILLDIKG